MKAPNFSIWSYMSESQRDSVAGRCDCHAPGYCPLPPPSCPKSLLQWKTKQAPQKPAQQEATKPWDLGPGDAPSPPQPNPTSQSGAGRTLVG